MSYCVNCGVELDRTAKKCALCGTEVCNPKTAVDYEAPAPYAQQRAPSLPSINRHYLAVLMTALLLLPDLICLSINILYYEGTWWALYVIGATMILWVLLVLRLLFKRPHPLLVMMASGGAVGIYLWMIAIDLQSFTWLYRIALPIDGIATLFAVLLILFCRHRSNVYWKIIVGLAEMALFLIFLEMLIHLHVESAFILSWSLVATLSLLALIIILIIIASNRKFQEELAKRLHL